MEKPAYFMPSMLALVMVIVLTACTSASKVNVKSYDSVTRAPNMETVQLFNSEGDVGYEFDEIATLNIEVPSASEDKGVEALTQQAGKLGATGVILGEPEEKFYWDAGGQRDVTMFQGIAIVPTNQ